MRFFLRSSVPTRQSHCSKKTEKQKSHGISGRGSFEALLLAVFFCFLLQPVELIICDDLCDNGPDILVGEASLEKTSCCLQRFTGLSFSQTFRQTFRPTFSPTFSPALSPALSLTFRPAFASGTLGFVIEYLTSHDLVHFLSEFFEMLATIQHPPDSERSAFLVVVGQSGFAACPTLGKLLKPSGEQALRPAFISFPRGAE